MPVCPLSPPPLPLAITHLLSVSVDLSIGAVHVSGVIRRGLLCLASLPEHRVFTVRPCCSLCQSSVWLRKTVGMDRLLFTYQLMDTCTAPTLWLL